MGISCIETLKEFIWNLKTLQISIRDNSNDQPTKAIATIDGTLAVAHPLSFTRSDVATFIKYGKKKIEERLLQICTPSNRRAVIALLE